MEAGLDHVGLLFFVGVELVADVMRLPVLSVILVLLNQVLIREEVLLEGIAIDSRRPLSEDVLVHEEGFVLISGVVRQLVLDHVALEESVLGNVAQSSEI